MTVMDLDPEQAIAVLRRRRQWTVLGAILTLIAALTALAAASAGMYSSEVEYAPPSFTH